MYVLLCMFSLHCQLPRTEHHETHYSTLEHREEEPTRAELDFEVGPWTVRPIVVSAPSVMPLVSGMLILVDRRLADEWA